MKPSLKQIQEWVSTIPEAKNVQRAVLIEKLHLAKRYPNRYDVKRLLWDFKILTSKVETLADGSIERAKQHPIGQLLGTEGRKGNISCPFHKDRTPSFQITKKNTFTCHSCGVYGDVIDLYKKLNNCDFKTAVLALQ